MADKIEDTQQEEIKDETVQPVEEVVEPITQEVEEVIAETEIEEATIVTPTYEFLVGDTIKVFYKIVEGDKFRVQPYEGIVIAINGKQHSKTFTVRRIGAGQIGIERIFPLKSPNIENITISKHGQVRRAKLYYLRDKIGKAATKIKERKVKVK